MEISRQNYEQYVVDYLDGKLNDEQVGILISFLEFNPDLKEEFTDLEKICLAPDETRFSGKASLLKSELDLVKESILKDFDMYCISSIENDIADEDEEILQGIIGDDPDRQDTYRLYQSTMLLPDDSVLFPGKARLKKRFIPVPYRIIFPAAAAVAAILIVLQVFTGRDPKVYQANQTFQSSETSKESLKNANDNREFSSQIEEVAQNPEDMPSLTGGEKSTGISTLIKGSSDRKNSLMEDGSISGAVPNTSRESIQLARIESISIAQLSVPYLSKEETSSSYLALRQSSLQPENGESAEISADNPRLSLWILADASVRGLNSVAEDEYHLDRKKDKNGNTRRITLDTPIFGISTPFRKSGKEK